MQKLVAFILLPGLAFLLSCRKDEPLAEKPFDLQEYQSNWTKMPYDTVSESATSLNGGNIQAIWFMDAQHGFMTSIYKETDYYQLPRLFETWDGGINWEKTSPVIPAGSYNHWHCDIGFFTPAKGLITWRARDGIYTPNGSKQTTDGGATWSTHISPGGHKIFVIDDECAIAGSKTTMDGGATWQIKDDLNETTDVYFRDTTFGIMVSDEGLIVKSTDFALSWDSVHYGTHWKAVTMNSANIIFAGGLAGIVKSADEGASWINVFNDYDVSDIAFVNNLVGFATAYDTDSKRGYILKTTDGGSTWMENYHTDLLIPTCLFVVNNTTIFAGCRQEFNKDLKHLYFLKTTTQGE